MKELVEYILATVILASSLVAYNFIMDNMSAPPDVVVDPTLLSLLSNQIKDLLEAQVLHGNASSPFFSFEKYLNQELGYILKDYTYRIEVVSGGISEITYDSTSKIITVRVIEPGVLNLLLVNQTQTGFTIVNTTVTNYTFSNGAYFYTVKVSSLGVENPVYAVAVLETPSYRYIDYLNIGNMVEAYFTEYNGFTTVALPSNMTADTSFNATLVYYGNRTYNVINRSDFSEVLSIKKKNKVVVDNTTIYYTLNKTDEVLYAGLNYTVYSLKLIKHEEIYQSEDITDKSETLNVVQVKSPLYNLLLTVFRDRSGRIYVARWYPHSLTIGTNTPREFPYSKLTFYARLGYFDYRVTVYMWRVSI